jgi:hypothetical protein
MTTLRVTYELDDGVVIEAFEIGDESWRVLPEIRRAVAMIAATAAPTPSITCPRCGMTSYHPQDIEHGWCGNCNDYTTKRQG